VGRVKAGRPFRQTPPAAPPALASSVDIEFDDRTRTVNIVYLDLLGTRKKWERGARPAVEVAFARFEELVRQGLHQVGPEGILDGGIEADSAALVCADEVLALRLSQAILSTAFDALTPDQEANRLWIRGAIVRVLAPAALRTPAAMNPPFAHLSVHRYSGPLLDAISVERSGFKGMRIIIEDVLVNDALREAVRIPVAGRRLIPMRRLDHSEYRANGFQDWLWMLPADEDAWTRRRQQMATRLRWAAKDPEEFLQAAATQVVFNECEAIRASLRARA